MLSFTSCISVPHGSGRPACSHLQPLTRRPLVVKTFSKPRRACRAFSGCQEDSRAAAPIAASAPPTCQPEMHNSGAGTWVQSAVLSAMLLLSTASASALQPAAAYAQQDTWTGPARVVDGDTLYIGEQKFRLYGVDAPEKAQPCNNAFGQSYQCGIVSKDALAQKVGSQTVQCKTKAVDQYGRIVAQCNLLGPLGSQQDLNKWLVENGYAVAYKEYGKDYVPDEEVAKAGRKGIWAGAFEYPAQWRKEEKLKLPHPPLESPSIPGLPSLPSMPSLPGVDTNQLTTLFASAVTTPPTDASQISNLITSAASAVNAAPNLATSATTTTTVTAVAAGAAGPDACGKGVLPIKGNINSKGTKIYHMPGGPYYDKVVVEVEKGESYFCSEADAVKAGYRPVAGNTAPAAPSK